MAGGVEQTEEDVGKWHAGCVHLLELHAVAYSFPGISQKGGQEDEERETGSGGADR